MSNRTAMHAVFYRNLNLGQQGSPTRAQLEDALSDSGADRVKSFQSNGTVMMVAQDPVAVVARSSPRLALSGYRDTALVCAISELRRIAEAGYFPAQAAASTYRETFTFFEGGRPLDLALPWTNVRDDVDIIHSESGIALGNIRKPKNTAGSPTAEIERITGGVATTRTRGSINRLLVAATRW